MESGPMKTYQLIISGKVQGVWYRASAKDKALELGLTGKIWNEPDGNVSAIVQGSSDKISDYIQWCKEGPPLAEVKDVKAEEIDNYFHFEHFDITRSK